MKSIRSLLLSDDPVAALAIKLGRFAERFGGGPAGLLGMYLPLEVVGLGTGGASLALAACA